MDGVIAGLINLGLGGLMAAALIWFLYHLVTTTLPDMHRTFHQEIAKERELRCKEHEALLQMLDRFGRQQQVEHEAIIQHVDAGLKELALLITKAQTVLERRLSNPPSTQGPRTVPKPR